MPRSTASLSVLFLAFAASWSAACGSVSGAASPDPVDAGGVSAVDAGAVDAGVVDAGVVDAGAVDADAVDAGAVDADAVDAGAVDAGAVDAGVVDAGPDPNHVGWARYTLAVGSHSAVVAQNGAPQLPLAGFSSSTGRNYQFILNASAMYVLTNPVDPTDQFDWNKLPGLSDCGQLDLAQDGTMFAWRWRLDTTPRVLELAHYANNAGTHLYPNQGIVTLDEADLRAEEPLRFALSIGGAGNSKYLYRISGTVRGRAIDVSAEHPRRCASTSTSSFKWASGFYFGGTSTAPSVITGFILEPG